MHHKPQKSSQVRLVILSYVKVSVN